MEHPAGSNTMPMQSLVFGAQQHRAPTQFAANGYGFIAPHPTLMYTTARDVTAFYPSTLAQDYSLPGAAYAVQPAAEKPVPTSAAESPAKPEPAPPPAKAPRASKKSSDKAGSTYASRHQAAESRRRQRINDRLDTLRKVVPHRDRANTAAFLEEVISYVVGLKKRLAELEGVSEDNLSVPQVDISAILSGATPNGGSATVMGNPAGPVPTPAAPAATTTSVGGADGMHVMVGGMPGQPMAVSGPVMTGMPFQDGNPASDTKAGMPARGMPAPALNANQVLVPVALMQHDQQSVGQQAYMLVNRDDFPMMSGQQHVMGMPPTQEPAQPKQAEEDGLMDVLVGAAVQVEGDADDHDNEADDNEDGDGTNSNKSLTTRSGRRQRPTQRAF